MDLTFVPVPKPHVADYVVIGIFLLICMAIGVYYGYQTDKQKTLENYFLGNRRLLLLPVAMSLFVTFASAISLMGIPAEIYRYGIRGSYVALSYAISVIIASVSVVPMLYPLKLTSTYEYLQLRFHSKGVRTIGALIGMLQTVAYMGVTLYAPALALQVVAGIPLWLSIVGIGLVGTIYTAIGGIKSVVWTDAFQFVMIFIGLAAVTIKGNMLMTDHSVLEIAEEGKRMAFSNWDPDPRTRHTIWGMCIGLTFAFLPNWCNQSSVQRVSSLRSLRAAMVAFWMLAPIVLAYFVFLGYLGILLYSYYHVLRCDPVKVGFLTNFNQLMPYYVLDVLRTLPGMSGVYISCLFSGALRESSTLSSGINALAANTVEDILGDRVKNSKKISQTLVAKLFGDIMTGATCGAGDAHSSGTPDLAFGFCEVFSYGLVVIGLAYGVNSMPGSITQMALSVFGGCGGPLAGLFFLGGLVPKANWIGAMTGSITALAFNMWIIIGAQMYGGKAAKLTQNPTDGCFASSNFTLSQNDTVMSTTPLDTTSYIWLSSPEPSTLPARSEFFLYNLSYVWYGFTGFVLTLLIGTLVSYCSGADRGEHVEARLMFPFCRKLFGLVPKYTYEVALMEEKNTLPSEPGASQPTPVYFKQEEEEEEEEGEEAAVGGRDKMFNHTNI